MFFLSLHSVVTLFQNKWIKSLISEAQTRIQACNQHEMAYSPEEMYVAGLMLFLLTVFHHETGNVKRQIQKA